MPWSSRCPHECHTPDFCWARPGAGGQPWLAMTVASASDWQVPLCARSWPHVLLFRPYCYFSHFTDRETEAQRGWVTAQAHRVGAWQVCSPPPCCPPAPHGAWPPRNPAPPLGCPSPPHCLLSCCVDLMAMPTVTFKLAPSPCQAPRQTSQLHCMPSAAPTLALPPGSLLELRVSALHPRLPSIQEQHRVMFRSSLVPQHQEQHLACWGHTVNARGENGRIVRWPSWSFVRRTPLSPHLGTMRGTPPHHTCHLGCVHPSPAHPSGPPSAVGTLVIPSFRPTLAPGWKEQKAP